MSRESKVCIPFVAFLVLLAAACTDSLATASPTPPGTRISSISPTPESSSLFAEPQFQAPLPAAERVSMAEAQARVPFHIPLPPAAGVRATWVSTPAVDPAARSVAILFDNEVLLVIHQEARPPDWDSIIATNPAFVKIAVNGHAGMGTSPRVVDVQGTPTSHPGSVGWWADGLYLVLYSDTLSLEDLLAIAESIPSVRSQLLDPLITAPGPGVWLRFDSWSRDSRRATRFVPAAQATAGFSAAGVRVHRPMP